MSWLSSHNQNEAGPDLESSSVLLQNPFYFPLTKMLTCTPRCANVKASKLLPYLPSTIHLGLYPAWAVLTAPYSTLPPILRILLFGLTLKERVLNWEQFCSPGNIWQCLEKLLIVMTLKCYWYLMGRDQGFYTFETFYSAQESPPQWGAICPKMSIVPTLRNPALSDNVVEKMCFSFLPYKNHEE